MNVCQRACKLGNSEVNQEFVMQQELEVKNTLREVDRFECVSFVKWLPSQQFSSGDFSAPVSRKMMANDASDLQSEQVLLVEENTF